MPASDRGSVRFSILIPGDHDINQVTLIGVKADAVRALVDLVYCGFAPLDQVLECHLKILVYCFV